MGTFPARYSGTCSNCDEEIEEGDLIGYVEDVVVCEECFDADAESRRAQPAKPFRFDGPWSGR